jgi:hypothetical protein
MQGATNHAAADRLCAIGALCVDDKLSFLAVRAGGDVHLDIDLRLGQSDAGAPGVDMNGVNFHAVGKVEPIIRISRRRLGRKDQRPIKRHLPDDDLSVSDIGPQIRFQRQARYPGKWLALPIWRVSDHHVIRCDLQETTRLDMQMRYGGGVAAGSTQCWCVRRRRLAAFTDWP